MSTRLKAGPLCDGNVVSASNSNLGSVTDSEGSLLNIPPSASVRYVAHNGTSGLQINTKKTRGWVPVILLQLPVEPHQNSKLNPFVFTCIYYICVCCHVLLCVSF